MAKFNPSQLPDLAGKVVIVTGGNAGIGKVTTINLLKKNAKVYIASRNMDRVQATIDEIKITLPQANVHALQLDLCDFASVKAAAEKFQSIEAELHILLNNAGVATLPYSLTVDGYDAQWSANYMGHHLFTKLLMPTILRAAGTSKDQVRIVNLSSDLHLMAPKEGILFDNINQPDSGLITRYGHAKLANLLHTKALAKRYGGSGKNIVVAAVHPGIVQTDLSAGMFGTMLPESIAKCISKVFLTPAEQGCWCSLYAAASSDVTFEQNGVYFVPVGKTGKPSANGVDEALADKLWTWTEAQLALKGY